MTSMNSPNWVSVIGSRATRSISDLTTRFDQDQLRSSSSDSLNHFVGVRDSLSHRPIWYDDPPRVELFLERNRGVRGARRRQAHVADRAGLDLRQHMSFETSLCFGAVEEHAVDSFVVAEERSKVICDLRIALDHRVQAACARAGVEDIPERDAGRLQGFDP